MGRGILPPCDTGGNVCILCNKFGYNTTLYRELTGSPQCRSVAAVPHSNVSKVEKGPLAGGVQCVREVPMTLVSVGDPVGTVEDWATSRKHAETPNLKQKN